MRLFGKRHDYRRTQTFNGSYGGERMGSVEPVQWTYTCDRCGGSVTLDGSSDGDMMRLHDSNPKQFIKELNASKPSCKKR